MLMIPPPYKRNVHFREQSPREGKRLWRYVTIATNRIKTGFDTPDAIFRTMDGVERARVVDGCFTLWEGYAYNGCSPKRHLPIVGWVGTPDFDSNLQASLWHDLFYQLSGTVHFTATRQEVDLLFRDVMRANRFPLAGAYYGAVRDFGGCFWGAGKQTSLRSQLL